jgi:hypothetical protein
MLKLFTDNSRELSLEHKSKRKAQTKINNGVTISEKLKTFLYKQTIARKRINRRIGIF